MLQRPLLYPLETSVAIVVFAQLHPRKAMMAIINAENVCMASMALCSFSPENDSMAILDSEQNWMAIVVSDMQHLRNTMVATIAYQTCLCGYHGILSLSLCVSLSGHYRKLKTLVWPCWHFSNST